MSYLINLERISLIEQSSEGLLRSLGIDTHEYFVQINKIKYYNKQLEIYSIKEHPRTNELNEVIVQSISDLEQWINLRLKSDYLLEHLKERENQLKVSDSPAIRFAITQQIEKIKERL